jgi:prevent-host-death family protein
MGSSSYTSQMKIANLSRVKDDLSQYVDYVRRGGRVRVLVRGVPAADLVPVEARATLDAADEDLADLERHGVLRRGAGGVPSELMRAGPKLRGEPLSATVAAERAAGW